MPKCEVELLQILCEGNVGEKEGDAYFLCEG